MERKPTTFWSWVVGIVACLLAILMWWIANGLDRTFQDNLDPDAPLGGSSENPLAADTTEFAT
jgi:4-amino-4-deoxy-L-arabinose transferase-like glycosyltransferase